MLYCNTHLVSFDKNEDGVECESFTIISIESLLVCDKKF